MNRYNVTKASGEKQEYNEAKLRRSLENAGAKKEVIDEITTTIQEMLFEGISTRKIYKEAFRQLRANSQKSAGRYKLKEAILDLGPTGFPFEKFVGELLSRMGYQTQVGIIVEGSCVSHEIDVIAHKENDYFMIECKFHNQKGNNCNVQIPLYIQSRFLDIRKKWSQLPGHKYKVHKAWVVTNTRFTKDAQQYGECVGLNLLGWDYPEKNGLKDLISRVSLHPVTCLSTLTKDEKQRLLEKNILFCMQIAEDKEILNRADIDKRKINRIAKEAREICNNQYNGL